MGLANIVKTTTAAAVTCAALAGAAFPPADVVDRLVRNAEAVKNDEIEGVTTGAFVEGDTPAEAFAAVRIKTEYFEDVCPGFFTLRDGKWKLAALGSPVIFVEAMGGDEGTVTKTLAGNKTYYVFSASEKSYGTGMGTEIDYYIVYDLGGGDLKEVFEGSTRDYSEVFSRWYGGENSTAWQGGGTDLTLTSYAFVDADGDGVCELWGRGREGIGGDGPARLRATLYAAGQDGVFAEADPAKYRPIIETRPSADGYLWLAGYALEKEGDVKKALAYYRKAADLDAAVARDLTATTATAESWAADPPEAIRLFFADKKRELLDEYPDAAVAADAVLTAGDLPDYLKFLREKPSHPRWTQAFNTAAALAVYDVTSPPEGRPPAGKKELEGLRKNLGRYLRLETDAENKAETLTWLADAYFGLGQHKEARNLFKQALDLGAESVFDDYDQLRLGDCEGALGNEAAALDAYTASVAVGGWWSYEAENDLLSSATVELGGVRRNFAEYLAEAIPDGDTYVTVGDLDGNRRDDLAVVVQTRDRHDAFFFFLRTGNEFVGRPLIGSRETGGPGALILPSVMAAAGFEPPLLAVEEAIEGDGDRVVYKRLYRFDGQTVREVARVKIGETAAGDPGYEYRGDLSLDAGPPLFITVTGIVKTAGQETPLTEKYVWNADAFAFERANP